MLSGTVRAIPPLEILIHSSPSAGPERVEDRSQTPGRPDRAITNTGTSTITITWPENHRQDVPVPAVLICPGGGYAKLAIDKEGHDIARWLNQHGYIAAVLKYRLPRADQPAEPPWPVEDGHAAMRILRDRAGEWGIQKNAIGILGSSAGGHLASIIATRLESSRPDFQILLYPVITFEQGPSLNVGSRRNLLGSASDAARFASYSSEKQVTPGTPPAFLVHAQDDTSVPIENSRIYQAALQKAGISCELMELPTGGHGFGLGVKGGDPLKWPPLCLAWLQALQPAAP